MTLQPPKRENLTKRWKVAALKQGANYIHPHKTFLSEFCLFHGLTPHFDHSIADIDFNLKKGMEFTCDTCGFTFSKVPYQMCDSPLMPKCSKCRDKGQKKRKEQTGYTLNAFVKVIETSECELVNFKWLDKKTKYTIMCKFCGKEQQLAYKTALRPNRNKWLCSALCYYKFNNMDIHEANLKKKNFVRIEKMCRESKISIQVIGEVFMMKSDILLICDICGKKWIRKVNSLSRQARCPNGCTKRLVESQK